VRVVDGSGLLRDDEELVVRAAVPALDDLIPRLAAARVAVRELAPVVPPLVAAFLALTESADEAPDPSADERAGALR
jgi:ABC-2 type transport system ATP-binding protein